MTAIERPANPLIGTSLHRVMQRLEEIQTHLEDDTRNDFEAAKRLLPVSDRVAVTLDEVKAELNRRYVELRRSERDKTHKPAPPKITLKMPGRNAAPVTFDRTARGITALLDFIGDAMADGGAGMVALNHELLDTIAAKGWPDEVAALRGAAMDALTPGQAED
jgi:hypothetical protein